MKQFDRISDLFSWRRQAVRSVYAEVLLENFFVAGVASVLTIRLYLRLTGYPRIAIGGLHMAHVLFGGLLMTVALVILLAFLNRPARELGAVVGGIGFGAFIDELGKYVTSDNDYFFEPTVALIYVAFVLLFFFIRFAGRRRTLSSTECLANALDIAKNATVDGLSPDDRNLAMDLLQECGQAGPDSPLRAFLEQLTPAETMGAPLVVRGKRALDQFYRNLSARWWFSGAVVGFFALVEIGSLAALVATIQWSWALGFWLAAGVVMLWTLFWSRRTRIRYLNILVSVAIVAVSILLTWGILASLKQKPLGLVDWAQFIFPSASGVIMVIGLFLMPVSRLRAYLMFRRAILVTIFFTQVLAFYQSQFLALGGLFVNILILLALRYMVANERLKREKETKAADKPVG